MALVIFWVLWEHLKSLQFCLKDCINKGQVVKINKKLNTRKMGQCGIFMFGRAIVKACRVLTTPLHKVFT